MTAQLKKIEQTSLILSKLVTKLTNVSNFSNNICYALRGK